MKSDRIILMIGARGSGKSFMQLDVMKELAGTFDFGVAMSPTMDTVREWEKCMPRSWIYERFSQEKLEDLISVQKRALREGREPYHLFLILDDCVYDKKVLKSVAMRELFCNGRHLRIHLSIAVQYLMDMDPSLRSNVDYIVAMKEKILNNRVKLHKYFFGVFPRFDDFSKCFEKCTEAYSAIVMDNTAGSSQPSDCIYWYRASNPGDFRMGKRVFWELSERHAKTAEQIRREEAARDEQERDQEMSRKKKAPVVISVEDHNGNWVSSTAKTLKSKGTIRM